MLLELKYECIIMDKTYSYGTVIERRTNQNFRKVYLML